MKFDLDSFHKAFESRIRLGIMSALAVNEQLSFNDLKEFLNLTDGNLASHIKALEKEDFINMHKSFVGKKPLTVYKISATGKAAFDSHLKALENFIKHQS
ncbi:MAG: transcriptional regulator [Pedobacter sp.]|nr:MAG: transcriptional regulator [Pedobacter sp.]